jgi:hypothetical protein
VGRRALSTEVGWELLSEEQRKFAEEWVRSHNHTQALTFAGYRFDPKNPAVVGKRIVKRCHRYIKYLEAKALRETFISIEAIQHQYVRIGFSNPLNYTIVDPVTQKRRPKALEELTRDEAAAIKEYTLMPLEREGQPTMWVMTDVKLHDPIPALRDLGKTIGAFPQTPPAAPPAGADAGGRSPVDYTRLPPGKLRQLDSLLKEALALTSSAQDAQAITVPGAGAEQESGVRPASRSPVPLLPSGSPKDSR